MKKHPSQANKVAGVPESGRDRHEEENSEHQPQCIQEVPFREIYQATEDSLAKELDLIRDGVIDDVVRHLGGQLNPRPENNSAVNFENNNFCEECIDKASTAINEGFKLSKKIDDKLTPYDTRLAAKTFLKKLNLRVNDHVSLEFFNREGMKKCLERDLFGGLPFEVARVVNRYGHNGKYGISEKLLGQHAYAATRSTGVVYDEKDQSPVIKLSDHSGETIGQKLNSAIGCNRCSCMQSKFFEENERKDVEKFAHFVKNSEWADMSLKCYDTVVYDMASSIDKEQSEIERESENLVRDAEDYAAPDSSSAYGDGEESENSMDSGEEGNDYDYLSEETTSAGARPLEPLLSSVNDEQKVCFTDDETEEDVSVYDPREDEHARLKLLQSQLQDLYDEYEKQLNSAMNNKMEGDTPENNSEEPDECAKKRAVDDDFRPSVFTSHFDTTFPEMHQKEAVESKRGDAPPLCLSICRHLDGNNCPFNEKNKIKIFNAINFVKQEHEGEECDGEVAVLIDGKRHKIELSNMPSFAIGPTVYEVLVYDHDPSTADSWDKNAHHRIMDKMKIAGEVEEWEDKEDSPRMLNVVGALCNQTFAKPCAKAYLTVTTAAVPWPCLLKTPPMSDFTVEKKYGSYRSFVVPLPYSFGSRRLSDSTNGWRSKLYTFYVEDFVKRSIRPLPKGRLVNLTGSVWSFSTRNVTHHQLKILGSVLRSECGDLDQSPLRCRGSTSMCSLEAVEARSDISKLRRLLDACNRNLDTFRDGPYREATHMMESISQEIEEEKERRRSTGKREDSERLRTLNGKFGEQYDRVVFMSTSATRQNNFRLQLERQLDNLSQLCGCFLPGF